MAASRSLGVEVGDRGGVTVEHSEPQRGRRIPGRRGVTVSEGSAPGANLAGVGQPCSQRFWQIVEEKLSLVEESLSRSIRW